MFKFVVARFTLFVLIALLFLAFWLKYSHGADVPSPLTEVKETINALKLAAKGQDKKVRRELIKKLILDRLDLFEMARRSLGRHWKTLNQEDRAQYVGVFSKFVEVYYREKVFSSIEFINSLDVKFLRETYDNEFADVDMSITAPDNSNTAITFKLNLKNGHWMAYDIVIENISTVQNYRSQFDRIINSSSFSELLIKLNLKIDEFSR